MKAVALTALETPPALREDLPAPTPEPDEVLVRVRASSVNPADNSIAGGMLKQMGIEYEFPVILGRDYAGVVEQVGADVTRYSVGDEVFGFVLHANPTVREGSWAEFIVVPEDTSIAPAPTGVDAAIAGAAPVAGIAAMTAIDALAPSEGETLLIVGATGGVGSFAVQLAARAGATVVAPALPEDEAYLRELGVSELLPRDGDLAATAGERHPDGFDAVLDLVNYAPDVPASLVKDGGRVASPTGAAGEGPGRTMIMAAPTRENLQRLGGLLADGTLRLPVQATYDLAEAPDALTALATSHIQGKLAIRIQ
ncbi:MAG TPA: NADP-dependent oxidoreductase [Gaiellaceae bacterium]|nr:NADP-dependent oxidoreductase [Gaiellaceae bacterium]